ncbi:hypothetical protein LIN78_08370 [Leeia sp. TBRC 13508]|uniref:Type 4 fimbrial biogenesis protein PilX N-terminal domain-containing protein n=1 Tax=Leeia speluncae TaxID=2884804 RepID=A0ABS8D5U5_9NEIS|nr:PilX N-terminal domain-containing pilus assembly protein [Leeia speluncae]MCB6183560.1 hypothetical protein [Leeia speluncae]
MSRSLSVCKNRGFALLVTLVMLVVLTIMIIGGVRSATIGEKSAGGYLERTKAFQQAEVSLRQGELQLRQQGCYPQVANGTVTISTAVTTGTATDCELTVGYDSTSTSAPTSWNAAWNTGATINAPATAVSAVNNTGGSSVTVGSYVIRVQGSSVGNCQKYSVTSRGVGSDSGGVNAAVVQSIVNVCKNT